MKWTSENYPWRKRFAIFPVSVSDGPTRETVWLQWYWRRFCGDCFEVSFTDPTTHAAPGGSPEVGNA